MTLVTWPTITRLTCRSLTHSTAVQSARNISMPTLPTWQTPVATIPAELFTWQCGWLWKMGCRIVRHHGIYGGIIEFLFRGPRFKTLGQTLKKLFTPNIEKALTFLDNSQLPSTSNAVERGYRRYRKMQRSVYRVRTQKHISQRIAIDMQREEQADGPLQTTLYHHVNFLEK